MPGSQNYDEFELFHFLKKKGFLMLFVFKTVNFLWKNVFSDFLILKFHE